MSLNLPTDARSLLAPHAMHQGWEVDLAPKKLFFVRGLTTFRTQFDVDVTRLNPYIEEMKEHLRSLNGWRMSFLDWGSQFSPRQIYAAYGKETISFDKAAQVILLAAVAAEARFRETKTGITGQEVLSLLCIEPQVYYLNGFKDDSIKKIEKDDKDGLKKLRAYCGQTNSDVFHELETRYRISRVTLKLACAMKYYLENIAGFDLGDIGSDGGKKPLPNTYETIDFSPPSEVLNFMRNLINGSSGSYM